MTGRPTGSGPRSHCGFAAERGDGTAPTAFGDRFHTPTYPVGPFGVRGFLIASESFHDLVQSAAIRRTPRTERAVSSAFILVPGYPHAAPFLDPQVVRPARHEPDSQRSATPGPTGRRGTRGPLGSEHVHRDQHERHRHRIAAAMRSPRRTRTRDPTRSYSTAPCSPRAQTITLTSGELTLTDSSTTTITGPSVGVTISGDSASRVFNVGLGAAAALSGLSITGGNTSNFLGGGGLLNYGMLTLTGCTVSGNTGIGGGGLLNYNGTLTLTDCTVSGNSTTVNTGGGLYIRGGTASLIDCYRQRHVLPSPSPSAAACSAARATTTLTDCTVSGGNTAGSGGASTAVSRWATTIVAGNTAGAGPDVTGSVTSEGNNLIGKSDGSSGWVGSDLTGTIAAPLQPPVGTTGR